MEQYCFLFQAMSRHSKWSKIKHEKGVSDVKRGQLFSKLGRAIAVAARHGADPATNFRLRMAIDAAREGSMPKDTIDRAIARASGTDGAVAIEEVLYEGFGPGGAAVVVEGTSDNKNRTSANIRHLFDKHGGNLGASGSVLWMFERQGVLRVARPTTGVDELVLDLIDRGARDVRDEDGGLTIIVEPDILEAMKKELESRKIAVDYATIEFVPKDRLALADDVARDKLETLIEALEEDEDVQNVFTNVEL